MKFFNLNFSSFKEISGYWVFIVALGISFILPEIECSAQLSDTISSTINLKKLSMEELMNIEIEVTSVSRKAEKLTEVASAIQVITREDIRRSTATSLPEALRLFPNLQVAQLNSYSWIISTRGFNAVFSNKLLVMIDGRTVYSPLFAGVYWDAQSVLLEDVERIEVVSGPGGTLWGANAVNGVINIITKNAKDTQGSYISGATGRILQNFVAGRYGGSIGSKFFYRVFGQHTGRDSTFLSHEQRNADRWNLTQGGFRMDWLPSQLNSVSLQGNFYGGKEFNNPSPTPSTLDGQNVLARWAHTISDKSDFVVQAYFDRTWRRDIPSTISDQLTTYDLDFQHRLTFGKRHHVLWGAGYRLMQDKSQHSTPIVGFVPENREMNLYSGFIQDEIILVPECFKLTLGSKLLHNVYTGFEIQPSIRLALIPNDKHTVWSSVSRAVRTPSRIDVDYRIPTYSVPDGIPNVAGGPNFKSEKVIAYELGYRVQPHTRLSLSLAAFYNFYNDLYSVEALPGTVTYEIQNGTKGRSWGTEFSGSWQVLSKWRIRGGYTYFYKELENKSGHTYDFSDLGHDPEHQASIQSAINLPWNFQFDLTARYVGELRHYIPDYFNFDARLSWIFKQYELSIAGQNLWEDKHREFLTYIPRNIYGKISCRF